MNSTERRSPVRIAMGAESEYSKFIEEQLTARLPAGITVNSDFVISIDFEEAENRELADWDEEAIPKLDSYTRTRSRTGISIHGRGPRGALYGAMDLADEINAGHGVREIADCARGPAVLFRALKLNLPWNPYRRGGVMQVHDETMRTRVFWRRIIDMLAVNRFNALTLWSLHPFHLMFRLKEYPEACDLDEGELEQWRGLWRFIFSYAKSRHIDTYLVTWNIFVSPAFAARHGIVFDDREYHIGRGDTREIVRDYNRCCVRELIDSYPDLTGIGTSFGERMENMTIEERQKWVEEVIYAGMCDAGREVKFIQRAQFSSAPAVARSALEEAELPETVWVEYKFNWSHGYSTPDLVMTHDMSGGEDSAKAVDRGYWEPVPSRYRMAWMVRNEDFFLLRWGGAEFIRSHIRKNLSPAGCGYFVGSEGMIPAVDYTHRLPHAHVSWDYLFEKDWYFYRLWGKLMYTPDAPEKELCGWFGEKYGAEYSRILYRMNEFASGMPTRLAITFGATWDYTLYSEGFLAPFPSMGPFCCDSPFISIDEFIYHSPAVPGLPSIDRQAAVLNCGESAECLITARQSREDGEALLDCLRNLAVASPDLGTLASELADLEAWAYLSLYLACKIEAAFRLQRFRCFGDPCEKASAVWLLEEAVEQWRLLCLNTGSRYRTVPYIDRAEEKYRLDFHWQNYIGDVWNDLATASGAKEGQFPG